MKDVREFLKDDYRKKALNISKDCLSFDHLCHYVNGLSPLKERESIESHLAKCYHCLDIVTSIYDGNNFFNHKASGPMGLRSLKVMDSVGRRLGGRFRLKKENLFLIMAVICFLSSFIFSRYFLQFLAATIILGIKWIVDSKSNKMLVMIYEAWKKGGEREAGRILKDIETKRRIDSEKFL